MCKMCDFDSFHISSVKMSGENFIKIRRLKNFEKMDKNVYLKKLKLQTTRQSRNMYSILNKLRKVEISEKKFLTVTMWCRKFEILTVMMLSRQHKMKISVSDKKIFLIFHFKFKAITMRVRRLNIARRIFKANKETNKIVVERKTKRKINEKFYISHLPTKYTYKIYILT
jgi:hypothetical protein